MAADRLLRDAVHEDGGPVAHNGSDEQQRSFDSTCRKLYRLLTQHARDRASYTISSDRAELMACDVSAVGSERNLDRNDRALFGAGLHREGTIQIAHAFLHANHAQPAARTQ